jgi:hypothetical protein
MATPRISFSGHNTFPLRFNWLKKGVDAAADDPEIFNSDRAIAEFGVGKNMVRAIRHWGLACGTLEKVPETGGGYRPTDFGKQLLLDDGWDPYLEDVGTAWLLHWKLCKNPRPSPLWHFVFACYGGREISILALKRSFVQWTEKKENEGLGIDLPADSTLTRDLDCLRGTYANRSTTRSDLEDALGSPFTSLNLVHETDGVYHFRRGPQPTLPAEVFIHSVLQFWENNHPEANTIAIQEILQRNGSPGRIFKISENRAFDLLMEAETWENPPFVYRDSAGNRQLLRQSEDVTAHSVLERYYASTGERVLA